MKYYHHLWAIIHLSALNFKKGVSSEGEYTKFYTSIGYTMTCIQCINHYNEYIKANPIDFENIFNWTVDLHNSVNDVRGTPLFTYEEAIGYWS
jgi:hypothetical protein